MGSDPDGEGHGVPACPLSSNGCGPLAIGKSCISLEPRFPKSYYLVQDISICYVVLSLNSSGIRFVAAVSCELFKVTISFEIIMF